MGLLLSRIILVVSTQAQKTIRPVTMQEALELFAWHNLALRVAQADA